MQSPRQDGASGQAAVAHGQSTANPTGDCQDLLSECPSMVSACFDGKHVERFRKVDCCVTCSTAAAVREKVASSEKHPSVVVAGEKPSGTATDGETAETQRQTASADRSSAQQPVVKDIGTQEPCRDLLPNCPSMVPACFDGKHVDRFRLRDCCATCSAAAVSTGHEQRNNGESKKIAPGKKEPSAATAHRNRAIGTAVAQSAAAATTGAVDHTAAVSGQPPSIASGDQSQKTKVFKSSNEPRSMMLLLQGVPVEGLRFWAIVLLLEGCVLGVGTYIWWRW
jgi:hypothetical protein